MGSDLIIGMAGSGGDGIVSAGDAFMGAAALRGYHALMTKSFGPQIRGGESSCRLRVSTEPILRIGGALDIAVALNWEDFIKFGGELPVGGGTTVVYDSRTGVAPDDLPLPGVTPREALPIPIGEIAKETAGTDRAKNSVVLGLLAAWTGEPFEYRGQMIRVTPTPLSKPHPFFLVGGMSKAAARRAARFGLPFYPPQHQPELQELYEAELKRLGKQGFYLHPGQGNSMLFVDDDPERAWQELAPYFLREHVEYSGWKQEGVPRPSEEQVENIDDLRSQRRFEILTPEECAEQLRSGQRATAVLHPLAGGVPVERAWANLRLFAEKALRPLKKAG